MSRRSLYTALALLIVMAVRPAAADEGGAAFINDLGTRGLSVLGGNLSPADREAQFRQLFRQDFDAPGIARFVLGRYWRTATDEEQREFLKLFEDYIVIVYSTRLSEYGGEQFKVEGSRS